jgi:hypothetical protein
LAFTLNRVTQIADTKCKLGLPDVEGEGGSGEGFAEQVAAQERGGAAGAGDDLQDLAEDLLLHRGQRVDPVTPGKCLRLGADRTLDQPSPPRPKALFHETNARG